MSIINSSTTGHNRQDEKKVANELYVALVGAVVVILAVIAFSMYSRQLNPIKSATTGAGYLTSPQQQSNPTGEPPSQTTPENTTSH